MTPLVTICIPTYNGAPYIRQCLESALRQTYEHLEILIVDDVSTDDTVSIIQDYQRRDARVRIFRNEKNLGLVSNWNRCVTLAKGQWIKFLFQDDLIEPDCLEHMVEIGEEKIPLVVCRRHVIFEPDVSDPLKEKFLRSVTDHSISEMFPARKTIAANEFIAKFLHHPTRNWIGEPTATLIHRSAFDRFGPFNPALASLCDWEFFARVAVNSGLCYLDGALASFRVHERSMSGQYRSQGAYTALYIDPLIIHHEMVYADNYAPMREWAEENRPAVNLTQKLFYAVREARLEAEVYAYDPVEPNLGPLAEWQRVVRKYPRVNSIPFSYLMNWVIRRSRQLLGRTFSTSRYRVLKKR